MDDTWQFDMALKTFVEGCQSIHTKYMTREFPTLNRDTFEVKTSKRYAKVVRRGGEEFGWSVHCFVDITNGDVLKAAGWKAPAKHARGNIFDEHNGLGRMGEYGPASLR